MFTTLHRYQDAIDMLSGLEASPVDVINLYPEFQHIADDFSNGSTRAPYIDPKNEDKEDPGNQESQYRDDQKASPMESLIPLMHYLMEQRNTLIKFRADAPNSTTAENIEESLYLSRVIDTTLLCLYLRVNESFASSLLRIRNFCDLDECEKLLLREEVGNEDFNTYILAEAAFASGIVSRAWPRGKGLRVSCW